VLEDALVHVAVGVGKQSNVHVCEVLAKRRQMSGLLPEFNLMKWLSVAMMVCFWIPPSQGQSQSAHMPLPQDPGRAARKAYDAALEAYRFHAPDLALEQVNRAIEKTPGFVDAWFLKAQILRDQGSPAFGETMERALDLGPDRFPAGWVHLAQFEWERGAYESGLDLLKEFEELRLGPLDAGMAETKAWVRAGLEYSTAQWAVDGESLQSVPMPGAINTRADEYYGALSLDGKDMILTRAGRGLQQAAGGEDFYQSSMNDAGEWSPPILLRGVNTRQNEGAPTWTGDGRTMIFTACASPRDGYGRRRGKGSCDLFETTWDPAKGEWGVGRNLGAPNSAGWESQPSVSADGQTLVFAQSSRGRNKPSDLVMCRRMFSGGWSQPEPLPGLVNTAYTEESPFLHPDGQTLYFSSDGHPGFGQLDVFVSRMQEDGTWGEPKNLGPDINSHGRDNSLMVSPDGSLAYFATTRGSGHLDLWQIPLHEDVKPIEVSVLSGTVLDNVSGQLLNAEVVLVNAQTGARVASVESTAGLGFAIPLPEEGDYTFEVSAQGFVFKVESYSQGKAGTGVSDKNVNIRLTPIEDGVVFTLEAIQFETGKSLLRSSYQGGCERLASWMLEHPDVRVRVEGHTDDVGSAASNEALSLERAQAVRLFLESRGVAASRVDVLGLGDSMPLSGNETEEGRSSNRRVEVVIDL
jgi:outer membrane protein OmpA-like peptidoglycan-associated protein